MNDSWPICETAFKVTYHPIYRSAQFYSSLILLTAVPPLTYFIFWKLIFSTFHGNLKWVMTGYFASVLFFDSFFILISLYQTLIPYFAIDKCDLLIDKTLFKYAHIVAIILLCSPMYFPFVIFIERLYATRNAESYERTPTALGPILTLMTVICGILTIAFIYKDEEFIDPSISFAFIPSTTALRMFTFYWSIFFVNIINFCLNLWLLRENRRLKKQTDSPLGVRYQLEEVYLSTKFAVSVIFIHIMFFGFYVSAVILVRYHGSAVFSDPTTVTAVRGAIISIMIPTYSFTTGVVAVYLYKRMQKKKFGEIRGNVQMKATGKDGAKNYDDAIFTAWNSWSSSTSITMR